MADHQREDRQEQRHPGRWRRCVASCSCSAAVVGGAVVASVAAAAGRRGEDSTGAGCSGSAWPSTVGSIQADSLPSLYVCTTGKVSDSASGNGPPDSANSWNSPGPIPAPAAAVNSTTEIASVISFPSSSVTGGSSRSFVVVAVQPGIGCVRSDASGVSVGIWMRTFTVLAASLSLGTRKVTLPKPPGVASVDETPTWAEARPVEATIAVNAASRTTASRTRGRGRDTELLFIGRCAPVSARGSRCWRWWP